MKIIKTIIICIILSLSLSISLVYADPIIDIEIGNGTSDYNLNTGNSPNDNNISNDKLESLNDGEFIGVSKEGERGVRNMLMTIAQSLKNIFFFIAGLYFLILVIRLVFTDNTEEEVDKFKKGVIWISVGLVVTQVAYTFVNLLYDKDITERNANYFIEGIIHPLINLLQVGTAFFFIAIAIYAFFRTITANGDEEKIKTSRMSIFYSLVGLIVVKLAEAMVETMYGEINCEELVDMGPIGIYSNRCVREEDLEGAVNIMINVINWVNSFLWIIVTILIIYAGFQFIFSFGDDEKVTKAKKVIIYVIVGIVLLVVNFLIMTFFINGQI